MRYELTDDEWTAIRPMLPSGVSFFHTLKTELVHHQHYATREQARRDIFAYIEGFYNRTRRHSAIGYLSPIEMELKAA
jgi:putative transposase